jgi:peptidoglycan/LPS O-acetylase OafA/YrhL
MALGMWHKQSPARIEGFLLRGAGLLAGLLLYPAAMCLYHNGFTYVFVDFATGACCLLEIVGVAGIIWRFGSLAKVFGIVGAFSYGLYLIHQPYVIWLGLRIRPIAPWPFLLVFAVTLAVLSTWGIFLEKTTNGLVNKLVPPRKGE